MGTDRTAGRAIAAVSFAVILSLAFAGIPVEAQTADTPAGDSAGTAHWLLGVEGGISYVHHSFGFRLFDHPDGYVTDGGTGLGVFGGLRFEYRASGSWSTSLGVSYRRYPGRNTESNADHRWSANFDLVDYATAPREPADTIVQYRTDVAYSTVSAELLNAWRPVVSGSTFSLGMVFGPMVHFKSDATIRQSLTVLSPDSLVVQDPREPFALPDNGNTRVWYDGPVPQTGSLGFAIRMGLAAEFGNLDSGIIVSPMILYEHWLTDVTETEPWTIYALSAQVSAMVHF